MSNLPHIISKRSKWFAKLSIRIRLIIFLSTAAGISYLFMLHFHNKAECERLEPNHVVCQQYRTSLDYARSIVWQSSAEESLINYRLIGTERKPHKLYLKTDRRRILYLYEPTQYQAKIPPAINQVENFIWSQGSDKMVLYLTNSRERKMMLYYLWLAPSFLLFLPELIANSNAKRAAK